jgi:hypothetical protein
MLALISLSSIRASAFWDLAQSNLVNIASAASEIKDFLFVGAIFTGSSVSIDQEHALGFDTSESLKIAMRGLWAETLEALLIWLFTFLLTSSLWLGGVDT